MPIALTETPINSTDNAHNSHKIDQSEYWVGIKKSKEKPDMSKPEYNYVLPLKHSLTNSLFNCVRNTTSYIGNFFSSVSK